jgi:hypothetical protein
MNRDIAIVVAILVGMLLSVAALGQRGSSDRPQEGNLKVGDPAPDFDLKRLDEKGTVKLSSFKGKEPVVLIFGSYT